MKITARRLHRFKFINSTIDRGGRDLTDKGKARLDEPRILKAGYGSLDELERQLAECDLTVKEFMNLPATNNPADKERT